MTQHVATCPHCASILRILSEDFADDLTPDEIKAENEMLVQLNSSTPTWQKDMARQAMNANRNASANQILSVSTGLASGSKGVTSGSKDLASGSKDLFSGSKDLSSPDSVSNDRAQSARTQKIFPWPVRRMLAPAAIAASALIAFGLWFTQRDTPEKVEKLLAQAYTEQRTMEMRIPYAAHADFRQTRSGESASCSTHQQSSARLPRSYRNVI